MSRLITSDNALRAILLLSRAGDGKLTSEVAASLGVSYTGAVKALGILAADGVTTRSERRWRLVDSPRTQALLSLAPALLPPGDPMLAPNRSALDSVGTVLASRTVSDSARRWLPVVTDRVVRRFHPERVILFGSQARGEATSDSDVDILVVVPDGSDVRRTTTEIYEELNDLPIAKDVVVVTASDVTTFGRLVGTILRPALEEGVPIYERV
ncbi:MAG TPA: nucleotidyltransferase domain-containing protein [Candidatus Limnocylindrales bacterium]|jgi:predicted nucleotidyltransferase